ncbi:hypothetical protein IW261DRAFT_1614675 [Armillaria novae-zelandiae]|uniref:Protein kinase domain-containing protein n=1 Tax=Armillaria novae-zelandiae TaxID=153914 RepID=A0AA39KFV2_9AGAR|nr:hypothetical protein IW261DRAFT_1614675 [Armillaria novae-zelandiae]
MKATGGALDTVGKNAVRLSKVRAGQDTMKSVSQKDSEDANNISSTLSVTSAMTMKRTLDNSDDESSLEVSRRTYDSQVAGSVRRALDPIGERGISGKPPNDDKCRIQCASDAMRMPMMSSTVLPPHALIDRARLQLYQGWDQRDPKNILLNGLNMTSENSEKSKIILAFVNIFHRQRGLIGRDTCVLLACWSAWPDEELVANISWPSIHHDTEKTLMEVPKAKAEEMADEGNRDWVSNHLPEIIHSQDFRSKEKESSQQRRLVEALNKAEYADRKVFTYEEHLRITLSERLFPITDLADVKDIGQVFLDIFRSHHWLYENAQILHRDMSLNNIMYRKRSKRNIRIRGVLNDFDLSSVIPLQEATSLHRTGTPPYMAYELLGQSNVGYLYRHDLEAFYYVLLMHCCRYKIVWSPEGKVMKELSEDKKDLPFEKWYDRTASWETLADAKFRLLAGVEPIVLSKSFSAFLPWLNAIRHLFRQGFMALGNLQISETQLPSYVKLPGTMQHSVPFDNDTLGGNITSDYILQIMSEISGHSLNK